MRLLVAAVSVALLSSSISHAVTLNVYTDKGVYDLGDTVHVTVIGDPQGAKETEILGRLEYSAALTTTITSSQTAHTRAGGSIVALTGVLTRGDGFTTVFNQIIEGGGAPPGRTVDNILIATATLTADAAGVVEIFWDDDIQGLDYFGLTNTSLGSPPNAVGIFCIGAGVGCPIPEPSTGALLGLGVLALAAGVRWRTR